MFSSFETDLNFLGCIPKDVEVSCFSDRIEVAFPAAAVGNTQEQVKNAPVCSNYSNRMFYLVLVFMETWEKFALFSNSGCSASETADGFRINSTFDNCGFQKRHENGVLIFSNSIIGRNSFLLGEETSFVVSCKFMDHRKTWTCQFCFTFELISQC